MAEPEREGAVEGRTDDWGQVVTRYPYENVGMDHLLSKEKDVRVTSEDSRKKFWFSFEGSSLRWKLQNLFFENWIKRH